MLIVAEVIIVAEVMDLSSPDRKVPLTLATVWLLAMALWLLELWAPMRPTFTTGVHPPHQQRALTATEKPSKGLREAILVFTCP